MSDNDWTWQFRKPAKQTYEDLDDHAQDRINCAISRSSWSATSSRSHSRSRTSSPTWRTPTRVPSKRGSSWCTSGVFTTRTVELRVSNRTAPDSKSVRTTLKKGTNDRTDETKKSHLQQPLQVQRINFVESFCRHITEFTSFDMRISFPYHLL